jgi:hypothetical protein
VPRRHRGKAETRARLCTDAATAADDEPALLELLEGLSRKSRAFRFFSAGTNLRETAHLMATDVEQELGMATLLLAHLAEVAQASHIVTFVAEVLPANHGMIDVFRQSGFPVDTSSGPGVIRVELPTSFSTAAVKSFEDRDRQRSTSGSGSPRLRRPGPGPAPGAEPRRISVINADGGVRRRT